MTELHDGRVTPSPQESKFFRGLNVGPGKKIPFQRLVPVKMQLSIVKKISHMYMFFIEKFSFVPKP
jgi:hypothetical protein